MRVFLSYAESDREVARELATRLEEAGHRVWFADSAPGEDWNFRVREALNEAEALVVLLSPKAMKSDWVRKEIEFALGALQFRGRLIPVMVRPTSDIPWILKKFPIVRLNKGMAEASSQVADYVEHGFELTPAKA